MGYESIFLGFEIDMLALESIITSYEAENGLDPAYLNSDTLLDPRDDEIAEESAMNDDYDFGFGATLFNAIALESEGADGATDSGSATDDGTVANASDNASDSGSSSKKSFGDKLKSAVKNVLDAVKKFFQKLGEQAKKLGSKIKEQISKWAAAATARKETKLANKVLSMAKNVRSNYQKAINILKESLYENATEVKKICQQINDAMTKAGLDNSSEANKDNLNKLGAAFTGDKDAKSSDKEVAKAASLVNKCEAAEKRVGKACELIKQSYTNLLTATQNLKITAERNAQGKSTDSEDVAKQRQEGIDKATKKAADKWNEKHDDKVDASEGRVEITNQMVRSIIMGNMYKEKTDISKLEALCGEVANICSKNADFCERASNITEKFSKKDDPNAKRAFNLCKLYFKASGVFNKLTNHINSLSTGTVLSSDKNGKTADYGAPSIGND